MTVDASRGPKKDEATPERKKSFERLLTIRQAGEFLSLSPGTLYHLVSQRRIPVVRLSQRCIRFKLCDLEEWVASHSHPAQEVTICSKRWNRERVGA